MASPHDELRGDEVRFHDQWASSVRPGEVEVNAAWTGSGSPENRLILQTLPAPRGETWALDLGCGCGEATAYLTRLGHRMIAADISWEMVRLTQRVTQLYADHTPPGVVLAGDQLPFKKNSLSLLYGANVLHHLDTSQALNEAHRVLEKCGQACFWDPLVHNPVIQVYRWLARKVRTRDEHPLNVDQLAKWTSRFTDVRQEYTWFTALGIFLYFYFICWMHPGKTRYWKWVVEKAGRYQRFLEWAHQQDRWLMIRLPFLRRFCWNVVLILRK